MTTKTSLVEFAVALVFVMITGCGSSDTNSDPSTDGSGGAAQDGGRSEGSAAAGAAGATDAKAPVGESQPEAGVLDVAAGDVALQEAGTGDGALDEPADAAVAEPADVLIEDLQPCLPEGSDCDGNCMNGGQSCCHGCSFRTTRWSCDG
jgi:hypothetical protein